MDSDKSLAQWRTWHRAFIATSILAGALPAAALVSALLRGTPTTPVVVGTIGGTTALVLLAWRCRRREKLAEATFKRLKLNEVAELQRQAHEALSMFGTVLQLGARPFQPTNPQRERLRALVAQAHRELVDPLVITMLRTLDQSFQIHDRWDELDRWPDDDALLEAVRDWFYTAVREEEEPPDHFELRRPDGTVFRMQVLTRENRAE